nr:3'(2'),5'-bisphosphate nucleotidase CysQ [Sphingomonas vulcanisoli]
MDPALVAAIVAATREAGALALRRSGEDYARWEKVPGHPVCDVDLEVDRLLAERLQAIDPEAGWLSEETADSSDRLKAERVWVVDPIDGTRDFLRGRPGWCISVALIEHGLPIVGVLDAPARDELWIAAKGQGATCNGVALKTSDRTALPGSRVPADTLPKIDSDLVAVPRANSIALRCAMVARAEVDLCASLRWGNEWDIAAAALIAEEAGAIVTDALGAPVRFNKPRPDLLGLLAAAPGVHAAAVERLAERAQEAERKRP